MALRDTYCRNSATTGHSRSHFPVRQCLSIEPRDFGIIVRIIGLAVLRDGFRTHRLRYVITLFSTLLPETEPAITMRSFEWPPQSIFWIPRRDLLRIGYEPSPSTFAVDTAVEKTIPSFTHSWFPNAYGFDYAIARSSCVRCEGEGSLV